MKMDKTACSSRYTYQQEGYLLTETLAAVLDM